MAVYKRDLVDINLETGNIHRSFLKHSIGYKDQQADHFGVRVYRDGEPVNLTGVSVQGVFMPPQGSPIAITTGNIVSDNVAEVVLPQACYNYDGQFTLAIKLVDSTNEVTGTVRIVDGMVDNTHASGTVAPTSAVPTYQEVLSAYEQAIAVIGASVRFDQTQSLTDAQKATARSNIGAPSTAEMNTALALKVNVSDIENDLTGTTAGKVLDARQGKVLDDKVSDLKSALISEFINGNAFDILAFVDKFDWSMRDVNYTWNADKTAIAVSGKATGGNSVLALAGNSNVIPQWVVPGSKYRVKYSATNVYLQVLHYKNNILTSELLKTKTDGEFTVPSDSTGIVIRLFVESGTTVDETVSPKIYTTALTNGEITSYIKALYPAYQSEGKYVAFGDSLSWGSVWSPTQGTPLHQVKNEWRIPTRIALAIGKIDNYVNAAVGGMGYIAKIDSQNIVDKIKAYDFSDVSFITVMAGPNDYDQTLGTANGSTANDGTICGAIKEIISYMKTNYPKIQIVFIQSTPYASSNIWKKYSTGGWSIDDFELEVSRICKESNVGYISWHGCTYVESWASLNAGYNGNVGPVYSHPVTDSDYLIIGNYLAQKISGAFYGTISEADEVTKTELNAELLTAASGTASVVLDRIYKVQSWLLHKYVDENNGEIYTSTNTYMSCSDELIPIPEGMQIHVHGALKIAKYDKQGKYISIIIASALDTVIDSTQASYIRIQYGSEDISVLGFYVAYRYSAKEEYEGIDYRIEQGNNGVNNNYETPSDKTGNPIVLNDCDNRKPFEKFAVSDNTSGEKIVICKKNIFAIRHTNGTFEKNNLYFTFNTIQNTIRIRSKTDSGASAISTSGFDSFANEFKTVNSTALYHNFKFRFPVDTIVSVSDNASKETPFDFPIQMRITDGTNHYEVGTGGLTFVAEAETEYAALFIVKQGWVGDITYSPQIEINPYPTAYEVYEGMRTTISSTGFENVFECGGTAPGRYTWLDGKIKTLFDCATNEIIIDATNDTDSDVLIYDTSKTPTVNGVTAYYLFKFTPSAGPVFVRSYNDQYEGIIGAQITDGINTLYDYLGKGIFFEADGSKEYAYRFVIRAGASVNMVLKPVISTGIYALKDFGTYSKKTVLYTDGSASLTVREKRITTKSKSINNLTYTKALETVTGGHILTPFSKLLSRGPMVSFVDDDTWNMIYVERYHDIFAAKNALGGYAVITENMRTDPNTMQPADPDLLPTLLEYEKEGFAMLYHCHDQNGVNTRYWIYGDPSYDEDLIRENFVTGLRDMADFGFSNYKYWVTPYGVNQKFIVDLAKNHGLQCIMNCPSSNYYQEGFTTPYGNVSRWNIPRVIFGDYSNNDDMLHRVLQSAKAANGWAIVVSHVNSWGNNVSGMTTRLSNLIQYCKDEGFEIVPFPVGFEEYRAAFMMNELF